MASLDIEIDYRTQDVAVRPKDPIARAPTTTVTGSASAAWTVPASTFSGLIAWFTASDPMYVDIDPTTADPTGATKFLVMPGEPVTRQVNPGDKISAILATDIVVGAKLVQEQPFAPLGSGTTSSLTVSPSATASPGLALPTATGATSYRIRNSASSVSPVTWTLSSAGATPVIPTPSSQDLTTVVAVVGDKTIDPGGVEIIALTAGQQAALAAGTLKLRAICPAGGSAVVSITPGNGG